MKKLFKSLLVVVGFVFIYLLHSCNQEDPKPNEQNYELYVTDRDQFPAWSPDGEHIAYFHFSTEIPEPANYPSGLYIIDKEGNNRQLVLQGNHQQPSWSPDGDWLVFSSGGVIQKSKIDGSELTVFMALDTLENPSFFFPNWSPKNTEILFSKSFGPDGGIYEARPDFSKGGRPHGLLLETGSMPKYSPDGSRFVYCKGDQSFSGGLEVFVIDTLGINDVNISNNNLEDLGPVWSPNGDKIAWSSNVQIHTMNADGTNQKALAFGSYPSWSVNDKIVYSGANAAITKEVLYTINPDGSNKTQLTF